MKSPEEMHAEEVARLLEPRRLALFVAGMATLVGSNLCVNLIGRHTRDWTRPREQRAIMAIIGLAPVVALDAYFGLAEMPGFEVHTSLLHFVKDCYLAFGVSEFLALLFAFLKVPDHPAAPLPRSTSRHLLHHSFPFTLFLRPEVRANRTTLNLLSQWIKQLVLLRPILSLLTLLSSLLLLRDPPLLPPHFHSSLSWLLTLSLHASLYLAAYALLLLYFTFEGRLIKHDAASKFVCMVPLVFLPYWQGLLVNVLVGYEVILPEHLPYTPKDLGNAVNSFLVCCEMLAAAVALCYAFSASEYVAEQRPRENEQGYEAADD